MSKHMARGWLAACFASLILPHALVAQKPEAASVFRADADLVLVRFQVSPKKGQFVTDLQPGEIEVREDGRPQKIAMLEGGRFHPRTLPFELTLLFDCNLSITGANLLAPERLDLGLLDEFEFLSIGVSGFSDLLAPLTPPTRDKTQIRRAFVALRGILSQGTHIYKAASDTALRISVGGSNASRAILVISDGETSPLTDTSVDAAIRVAKDRGVAVYPLLMRRPVGRPGVFNPENPMYMANNKPLPTAIEDTIEWTNAVERANFLRLGPETGGESKDDFMAPDFLSRILRTMATRIRFEYVVGYYSPPPSNKQKRREVQVVLKSRKRGHLIGGTRTVLR